MIRPHVAELGMPDGRERARLCALRALRNCGVIRVTIGRVPLGYRLLVADRDARATKAPGADDKADCRLTRQGHALAAHALRPPRNP